ncbi:hypothetical protein MtrunA17_Chr6g0476771 [Medicago truncatula]|uniref:Uncharacterized protein n=1 Tax=Medicago truncatula TaxID=3880 RepID=A0A396HLE9_MEDTR|nr:hypothetical protein MtrunA17_Chr6g0476771 [Medicago truncatula]
MRCLLAATIKENLKRFKSLFVTIKNRMLNWEWAGTNYAEQIISSQESSDSNLLQIVLIVCAMFINSPSMDQGLLQILFSETYVFIMCFY